jgi:glycosyltransferase involved in cell wall biosynthesis
VKLWDGKVTVVTMAFPAPSEAFAGVEFRALRRLGVRLQVHALRPAHRMAASLLEDWKLGDLRVTHATTRSVARGFAFMFMHPWMSLRTIGWLLTKGWRRPGQVIRGMILLPRCLDIFADCLRERPDLVHLFWGHYPATLGYLVRNWLKESRVSTSLGAYDLLLGYGPGIDVARQADSVWTQATCNVPDLAGAGIEPSHVHVLVRGVDLEEVPAPSADRDEARIVTVARLVPNKGVSDVLHAFASVHSSHPAARLDIIGEGPQRPALLRLAGELGITEKVTFHGACGHSAVLGHLSRAGILLLLSRNPSERLPNAMKEAMACGCLCIVTRTPGIEELATAWPTPRVVEQGDWRAAAALLDQILARPGGFAAERDAARNFAFVRLDAAAAARARIEVWRHDARRTCAE